MNSLLHTCLNIEMLVVLMLLYNFMIMHILYLNLLAAKNPYSYDKMPYNIYIQSLLHTCLYVWARGGGGGEQIFCHE